MAEKESEEAQKTNYKDHYKTILADLIGKRNSAGILENEEAIEGIASNGLLEVGNQHQTDGAVSYIDSNLEMNRECVTSSSSASCQNLRSSLSSTLMDDGLAVVYRKVSNLNSGTAYPLVSDNRLLDDRKTPEGDLPSLVQNVGPHANACSSLTPEPSLMSLGEEQRGYFKPTSTQQKKNKWKIFKGLKNPLSQKPNNQK